MYKGITLNQLIGELQELAKTRGNDELRSIGACSGKIFGLTSPYCLNFVGDRTEYIPAFSHDVKKQGDNGLKGKEKGAVPAENDGLGGEKAQVSEGDLISRGALLAEADAYFSKNKSAFTEDCQKARQILADFPGGDLVVRGALMDALLSGFGCDLAYYGGHLRWFQEAVALVPAVQTQTALGMDVEQQPKAGELRHVWARVGMTLDITPEEEKAIFEGDYLEGKEAVMKVIETGRASVDGETYIPQECIEDFDQEYGTDYRHRDEECAWSMDGEYVNASEAPHGKLVADLLVEAEERSFAGTRNSELGTREGDREF